MFSTAGLLGGDSGVGGGPHADILQAPIPVDSISRTVLLQECKHRAKAALSAQQYPTSIQLYTKAIDVVTHDDKDEQTQELAILHSNVSLCHAKMHQWDAALTFAKTATEKDPTYVKGWWRLGQAHASLVQQSPQSSNETSNHTDKLFHAQQAVSALEKACQLEPTNKALGKELSKFQTLLKNQQLLTPSPPQQGVSTKTTTTTTTTSPPKTTTSTKSSMSKTANVVMDDDDKDEEGFSKSDIVRGYKIVNGKKTSYFHNELSEDVAQLIGDIRPKKLEDLTVSSESTTTTTPNDSTVSAWNKAGTWEERDVTQWAVEQLQTKLQEAKYTTSSSSSSGGTVVAQVSNANVTGSASVAVVRNKKKYIYELAVTIEWQVVVDDNNDKKVLANGTLQFPDIDGTCMIGEPYEATEFTVTNQTDDTGVTRTELHNTIVFKQGLRDSLHQAIDAWVELFRETY